MGITVERVLQQGIAALKGGKLQDAERFFRAILQSHPKHPDANHNLGVLAVSVDKPAMALPFFKVAVGENPKVEQFWLSYIDALIKATKLPEVEQVLQLRHELAVAYNNFGNVLSRLKRLDEAEAKYTAAIAINPSLAEAHSNLGNVLLELGRLDESEACCNKAIRLEAGLVVAHNNLGNALFSLRRLEESAVSFKQAIALKPDFAEAYSNLGNTLKALGKLSEAEASYTQAMAINPNYARAYNGLGNTLKELGRFSEAELSIKKAITLKPDYAQAHHNLGNILREDERYEDAEASYKKAIASDPKDTKARYQLLTCLFMQDKKLGFFEELDYLINQNKASAIIGSLACRSALKYGIKKPNLFCSRPLNYVLRGDLKLRYNFQKIFVQKIKYILQKSTIPCREQALLINGNQTTGNLFEIEEDNTAEIRDIIQLEIERYRKKYSNSEEGLIKKFPPEYDLQGWLISMKNGGSLRPHIHTDGWLSGSIYINVPHGLNDDSGNLVVCIDEKSYTLDSHPNPKKIINVETGSIVLFPASLMHYTIPFESKEERIVLAFDVKEK